MHFCVGGTNADVCEECGKVITNLKTVTFTTEELDIVRWMADLIKAQALSEKQSLDRLYAAYSDREFVHDKRAKTQIDKCNRILSVLNSTALG